MNTKCLYIPREINEDYILLWKKDEFTVLFLPWIFFFLIGGSVGFMLTLVTIIIAGQLLKQLSIDKPSGYLQHWVKYNIPKQFVTAIFSRRYDIDVKGSLFFKGETFPPSHFRHIEG